MMDIEHIYWMLREWLNAPSLSNFESDREVLIWMRNYIETKFPDVAASKK